MSNDLGTCGTVLEHPELQKPQNVVRNMRDSTKTSRAAKTAEHREKRLRNIRDNTKILKAAKTADYREKRLRNMRDNARTLRAVETAEHREEHEEHR